jgi:hypothetical protein
MGALIRVIVGHNHRLSVSLSALGDGSLNLRDKVLQSASFFV